MGASLAVAPFRPISLPEGIGNIVSVIASYTQTIVVDDKGDVYLTDMKATEGNTLTLKIVEGLRGKQIKHVGGGLNNFAIDGQRSVWTFDLDQKCLPARHKIFEEHFVVLLAWTRANWNWSILTDKNTIVDEEGVITKVPEGVRIISLTQVGPTAFGLSDNHQVYKFLKGQCELVKELGDEPVVHINSRSYGEVLVGCYGLPKWTKETHKLFPSEFKEIVKTMLIIQARYPDSKLPRHPGCLLHTLPDEILLQIFEHVAYGFASQGTKMFSYSPAHKILNSVSLPASNYVIDVAAAFSHIIALSGEGDLYFWGSEASNNGFLPVEHRIDEPTLVPGIEKGIKKLFCGPSDSFILY